MNLEIGNGKEFSTGNGKGDRIWDWKWETIRYKKHNVSTGNGKPREYGHDTISIISNRKQENSADTGVLLITEP